MGFYALSALINGLSSSTLGIFVYLKNRKGAVNRAYGWTTIFIGIWSYSYFFWQIAISESSALFWCRALMAGAIFIPPAYLHFVLTLLGFHKEKRKVIISSYVFGSIFFVLNFTSLFVKDVSPKLFFNYWPNAGVIFLPFLFLYSICVLYAITVMVKEQKRSGGIRQLQIRYVILGAFLGFGGGATNYPLWYGIPIPPMGNILVSIGIAVMAYAIIKYRLMDITLVWRQVLIFAGYLLAAGGVSVLVFLAARSYPVISGVIVFILLLTAPFTYRFLQRFSQPFVDKVVLKGKYNYWDELKRFWEKERVVFTSGQLADTLKEISEVMGLESFSFFLVDRDRKNLFVPRAYQGLDGVFDPEQAEVLNTIYPDDPLVMYLEKEKRIITRDELVTQSGENHQAVLLKMDEIKAVVSAPLFVAARLTGILNLGPKKNREMYHQQDMELLKQVVRLAEKHLAHISFFDSSIIFSGSVAHDIRKPFRQGIIFDYLADIHKGLEHPENISTAKESLDNLKHLLGNLHNMSEDMVDAFKNLEIFLKTGFKPQKIDYVRLINEEIKSFKSIADERRIAFEIALPKTGLFLYADPLSVQRILNELLTNAFKYTDKGRVRVDVSYQEDNNHREILTEVSDTGCGISEEDHDEIWELFKRVEEATKREGTGIGLAMVRQLVEANGGKISVNSTKGNGSNFFFTLPAWEDKKGDNNGKENLGSR